MAAGRSRFTYQIEITLTEGERTFPFGGIPTFGAFDPEVKITAAQYKQVAIGRMNEVIAKNKEAKPHPSTGVPAEMVLLNEYAGIQLEDKTGRDVPDGEVLRPMADMQYKLVFNRDMAKLAERVGSPPSKPVRKIIAIDRGGVIDYTTKVGPSSNSARDQRTFNLAQNKEMYDFFRDYGGGRFGADWAGKGFFNANPIQVTDEILERDLTRALSAEHKITEAAALIDAKKRISDRKAALQPKPDDVIIKTSDEDYLEGADDKVIGQTKRYQVLPQVVDFVRYLDELVNVHGYIFLSHSADKAEEQEEYYTLINNHVKKLNEDNRGKPGFPIPLCPTPLFYHETNARYNLDPVIKTASILSPSEAKIMPSGKQVFRYPDYVKNSYYGKQELRFAQQRQLLSALSLPPTTALEVHVLDDAAQVIKVARLENNSQLKTLGYPIGSLTDQISPAEALRQVVMRERQLKAEATPPLAAGVSATSSEVERKRVEVPLPSTSPSPVTSAPATVEKQKSGWSLWDLISSSSADKNDPPPPRKPPKGPGGI